MNSQKFFALIHLLGNISAFIFFALLLPTKSGHSIAIVLVLLVSILAIPLWKRYPLESELKVAAFLFLFSAVFWSHKFDDIFSVGLSGDHLFRYSLGILFIVSYSKININPKSIFFGISVGCIGAGVLAVYQYKTMGRAEGFTNAVRFGNIAMLMFLMCFAASFVNFFHKKERVFFLFASFFGLLASVLSLSRGGWIILLFLPFVIFSLLQKNKKTKFYFVASIIPIIFVFMSTPPVWERIKLAESETIGYFHDKDQFVGTSVGARLEQWRVALLMGAEKPLTGWGDENIKNGKLEYVERLIADPSIMDYNHAHNELLETWARRGVLGVISLIVIYVVPVYFLLLTCKKINNLPRKFEELKQLLLISGLMIYVGYFFFGLFSVFFKFVIGHNFYLFSLIFIYSSICWVKHHSIE